MAARAAAWRALRRVHSSDAWSAPAVRSALARSGLDARDRAYAASLAYEALRWEGTLDWALSRVLTRPLADVQPDLLDVLRLGAWELLHGAAPDHAAVDAAVELARREVGPRATGFTNGVLRGLVRARSTLPWPSEEDDAGLGLALAYPAWVVAQARARFGERAREVLAAGNVAPGAALRAVGDRDALLDELRAGGASAEPGRWAPESVRVPGADPAALPAVAAGRAVAQDEASTLVGRVVLATVGDQRDALVLDACAAPGGKTTHLAQGGARVVATELHPGRASVVSRAARTVGLAGRVGVVAADATMPAFAAATFDAALVDAPCTGLGVVRRRPEVRWRREPSDVDRLAALQLALLEATVAVVRPGGVLVYSACTWTPAETVGVAEAFLAVAGDVVTPLDIAGALGGAGRPDRVGVQLDPAGDDVDGMYVAAFRVTG